PNWKPAAQRVAQFEAQLIPGLGRPADGDKLGSFRSYLGSFDAITSIFSIEGDLARRSAAFSIRACATLPFKCASRPESSAKVSKIPYLDGPILIANHDTVFGSASTNACPACKNFSTSASLPGFASSTTHNAFPFMTSSFLLNFPSHIRVNEATVVPCSPAHTQRQQRQRNFPPILSGRSCPACPQQCGDN